MTLQDEIKSLPMMEFQALLKKRFFDYANIKKRKEAIKNYVHMNMDENQWGQQICQRQSQK